VRPYLKGKNLDMVVHAIYPSYAGSINRRITVQARLGKKQDPISKITRAKRVGGVKQAVEYLPRKYENLSSNPSTTKNKQKNQP
jgi:hypothetical protein